MGILAIETSQTGQVGVLPSYASIQTNDTMTEILEPGYLNHEVANGISFQLPCIAKVSTKESPTAAAQVGWYQVVHSGTNWSLVAGLPILLQYARVDVTSAEFLGAYAAPKLLVPAPGANLLIVHDRTELVMTYNSAAYAGGGVAAIQYDSTINGAGVLCSTTNAAAAFQATASTSWAFNQGAVAAPFTTTVNKGLYLSNLSGAFTTGDSPMTAHVWFKVIQTV
jgi:hypothetical protein